MIPSLCGILRDFSRDVRYGLKCLIPILYIVLFGNLEGIWLSELFLFWINSGVVYSLRVLSVPLLA